MLTIGGEMNPITLHLRWLDNVRPVFKVGFYEMWLGVGLMLQGRSGVAWWIDQQVPIITHWLAGLLMIVAGVTVMVVSVRVKDPIRRYQLERWPAVLFGLYVMATLMAAVFPIPRAPDAPAAGPLAPLVMYIGYFDHVLSTLRRKARDAAKQSSQ